MSSGYPETDLEQNLKQHGEFVRRVARRLVFDENLAHDLEQQTWLAALENRPEERQGLRSWLAVVLRNFASRRVRSEMRRASREAICARPEAQISTEEIVQRQVMLRQVVDAVLDLKEPFRTVVLLRFYEDLEPQEIARRLALPGSTVRTRLKRGLDQLRSWFEEKPENQGRDWRACLLPVALAGTLAGTAVAAPAAVVAAATGLQSSTLALGGFVVTKKIALVAGVLAAITVSVSVALMKNDEPVQFESGQVAGEAAASDDVPVGSGKRGVGERPGAISSSPFERKPDRSSDTVARGNEPMATLLGRVVDSEGTPVAGSSVIMQLWRARESLIGGFDDFTSGEERSSKAGADGRFEFADVPVGWEAVVRARPEALCDVVRRVEIGHPREIDVGDLVAQTGGSISGTVRDAEGNALSACEVVAYQMKQRADPDLIVLGRLNVESGRKGPTGADGTFTINGLAAGEWVVATAKSGFGTEVRRSVHVAKGKVTSDLDTVLERGQTLRGIAQQRDGTPLAGVRVFLSEPGATMFNEAKVPSSRLSATTGKDGHFAITGLKKQGYALRATRSGFAAFKSEEVHPGAAPIVCDLVRRGLLHGTVIRGDLDQPVEAFGLRTRRSGLLIIGEGLGEVMTGEAAADLLGVDPRPGLFAVVGLPESAVELVVSARGLATQVLGPFTVRSEGRLEVDVRLVPQVTLAGTVFNATGAAVANAMVSVRKKAKESPEEQHGMQRRVRRVTRRRGPGSSDDEPAPLTDDLVTVSTGTDGKYRAAGLGAGAYTVVVAHEDHANSLERHVDLAPGAGLEGVDLYLRPGGTLQGQAFDADGAKLPGMRVVLSAEDDQGHALDMAPRSTITDTRGHFSFAGLLPGRWRAKLKEDDSGGGMLVRVHIKGQKKKLRGVLATIEAGRTTTLELRQTPRARLIGTVSEAGKPVEDVTISLRQAGSPLPMGGMNATTDEAGAFVFESVPPGDYVLAVRPVASALPIERDVSLQGGRTSSEDVSLPTGIIEGRAFDPALKAPVSGMRLTVERSNKASGERQVVRTMVMIVRNDGEGASSTTFDGNSKPVMTDAEGRFELRNLAEGEYTVSVKGQGYMPASKESISVREGRRTRKIDFDVVRGAKIIVTAEKSDIVPEYMMAVLEVAGEPGPAETKVAERGKPVTFDGLKPGSYKVTLRSLDETIHGSQDITLTSGKDVQATIRLKQRL